MKILINCSNHPSTKWDPAQKEGWDIIEDVHFPAVPPEADMKQTVNIFKEVNHSILCVISKYWPELLPVPEYDIYLMVMGEYTLSYLLFDEHNRVLKIAIPTTRREVVETPLPDGGVKKETTFKFVSWRIIDNTR